MRHGSIGAKVNESAARLEIYAWIEPNVLLTGCKQESPAWREFQIWSEGRIGIGETGRTKRNKEVSRGTHLATRPDVPAVGVVGGCEAHAVQGPDVIEDVPRHARVVIQPALQGLEAVGLP
jgi:hypothetical protein